MAVASAFHGQSVAHSENLETFGIVWLDGKANHDEQSRKAQQKLRDVINYLKTFEDPNDCQKYIEQTSDNHSLLFIVSGRLGQEVVPRIHHLRQVFTIYVYCMDKKLNEKWAKDFKKVRNIHASISVFLIAILL